MGQDQPRPGTGREGGLERGPREEGVVTMCKSRVGGKVGTEGDGELASL